MKAIAPILLVLAALLIAYTGHVTSANVHCHNARVGDSIGCV